MRELKVSALLELARRDNFFGIAGDSERHSRPEEISLLFGPVGIDRFNIIACSIDNSCLEADGVCILLEIATEDVSVIVAYSVGDSERGSKAAEYFAMSFNSNAPGFKTINN